MTGTGTQADPYIPTTWAEFVTAVGTSGAYVECAEGTEWDMNEIAPEGISSAITVSAISIEGNGAIIKNLFFVANGYFSIPTATSIAGLSFLNVLVESSNFFRIAVGLTIKNCLFSGLTQDSTFLYQAGNYSTTMSKCSFNLNFQGNSLFYISYHAASSGVGGRALNLTYCNVKLSGKSTNSSTIDSYDSYYKYNLISFTNCLISGTNPFKYLYICWNSTYSGTITYSRYSIFDLTCDSSQTITNAPNSTLITSCLINSDKINDAIVNSAITQVTENQLHDVAYLQSIGFPIGVDEE